MSELEETFQIIDPFKHRNEGAESKLVLVIDSKAQPDPILLTNIAKARDWLDQIKQRKFVTEIATQESRSVKLIQRHLKLAFL